MSSPAVENKASNDAKPQREQQKKEFRRKSGASSPSIEKGNEKANGQHNSPQNGRQNKNKQQNKDGEKKTSVNERFDNSSLLAAEGDNVQDPAFSLKVSESKRMNDIVPPGLSPEVLAKVKNIQAVLPNYEFHHIYAVLERCRFDDQETINVLMESRKPDTQKQQSKGKQQQQQQQQQQAKPAIKEQLAHTPWASVVKGQQSPSEQTHHVQQQHQPQQAPQQHQPQPHPQHQQPQHQIPQHQPLPQAQHAQQVLHQQQQVFNGFANPLLQGMLPVLGITSPEDVVNTLSSAISDQLQVIMEKSKQLMAMQEELHKITSTDKSEMQQLVDRKVQLQDEQRRLHEQLRQNEANLAQVEDQIAAKGREKVVALQSLTVKSAELGVVEIPRYPQGQPQQQYANQGQPVYHEQPQQQQPPQEDAQAYQQYNGQQNGQQRNKGGNRGYNNNGNGNYQQQQPYRGGRQQGNRY